MAATLATVACKLPSGLIVDHGKIVRDGDGKAKVTPEGAVIRENVQTRHFVGSNAPGAVGGYGLTANVDADWFLDWMEANPTFPPIRDGLIFMNAKPEAAAAQAKDRKGVKSGFDPVDASDAKFQAPGVKLEQAVKE